MIRTSDLSNVVRDNFHMAQDILYVMMTDYNNSPAPERDEFTSALFRFLKALFGYSSNPSGSFTTKSARKVISEETNPQPHYLGFSFNVVGRFDRLEKGKVDFRWIWDKWLEDAIKEQSSVDKWIKIRGVSRQDIVTLKRGPPADTPARPYVEYALKEVETPFAEDVDQVIRTSLTSAGRRFR